MALPPHRRTTTSLIRSIPWAGMTSVDDRHQEYVCVACVVPLEVIDALVTRLDDHGGVAKAHKQIGRDVIAALTEVYAEGDLGDWPFGDEVDVGYDEGLGQDDSEDDDEEDEPDDDTDDGVSPLDPDADFDFDDLADPYND